MPSEKRRYMNRGIDPPFDAAELRARLSTMDSSALADVFSVRAQYDPVSSKILQVIAALRSTDSSFEKAKAAIDYALWFPDYIRYFQRGYGQLIDEIRDSVDFLVKQDRRELAI